MARYRKNPPRHVGSIARMNTKETNQAQKPGSEDFAVVGVFGGSVVLEANEWDLAMGIYRVVTLYLDATSAQQLAEQLVYCAAATTQDGIAE